MAKSKRYRGVYTVKREDGLSYGIDYIHPQTGQRIRKILKNVNSEADAFELRSIEISDAKRGAVNKLYELKSRPKTISFESMIDEYLKWSRENKKSWATDIERAKPLKMIFQGKLMSDINPFMVEKYKMIRAKDVEKSTVNSELTLGRQVFVKAKDWSKYDGDNPFAIADKFVIKKQKKPGSLSPDDVQAIMDEIKHPVKKDMVEFAFNTGWRISELRKLKWDDVDLDNGRAWLVDTKNKETVEIELNDEATAIISRQTRRSEHVFCKLNGDPWKTNINAGIKNAAHNAGVYLPPRKAWHIFRRTWASMFLQSGGDVETLRVLGNWKTHEMPLWYADAADSKHKKAILNKLPKLGNGRKMADSNKVVQLTD